MNEQIPESPPHYQPSPGNYPPPQDDQPNFLFALIGFFLPVIGFIMWLVMKGQTPRKAASAGKGALAGFITGAVMISLVFISTVMFARHVYHKLESDPAFKNSMTRMGTTDSKTFSKSFDLSMAITMNDIKKVTSLLDQNPQLLNGKDMMGDAPIHGATFPGHEEILNLLIQRGADVNIANDKGVTPLDKAQFWDNEKAIAILKQHGAVAGKGVAVTPMNPADAAQIRKDMSKPGSSMAPAEIGSGDGVQEYGITHAQYEFLAAVMDGKDVSTIQQQLAADPSLVKVKDSEGNTALHHAAFSNKEDILNLLIQSGADVNAKNKKGETPLSKAEAWHSDKAIAILQQHGAVMGAQASAKMEHLGPSEAEIDQQKKDLARKLWHEGADAKHRGDYTRARLRWGQALNLDPNNQGIQDSIRELPK